MPYYLPIFGSMHGGAAVNHERQQQHIVTYCVHDTDCILLSCHQPQLYIAQQLTASFQDLSISREVVGPIT